MHRSAEPLTYSSAYLLLDAWIANQDRHHENWGVINYQGRIHLAPSYDHAAALGQNETDETRKDRLETRDRGRHISRYVQRARSAIYEKKTDAIPLPTIDAFRLAGRRRPHVARYWLDRLQAVTRSDCLAIFGQIPPAEISEMAVQFALTMLELNRNRLLDGGLTL